jgi:amino acid adenylation domain-containing protein
MDQRIRASRDDGLMLKLPTAEGVSGGAGLGSRPTGLMDAKSAPVRTPECLHEAVRAQAHRRPGACALVFQGRRFSYEWLEDRAEQLASLLVEAGVRLGDVVALHLERSQDLVAAVLAVLKAGAAYLPLDPHQPAGRLEAILADAAPAVVLGERASGARLDSGAIARLYCDATALGSTSLVRRPVVGRDDLAYVLYTSGSTGRPKGVEVTHGSVLSLINFFLREPNFTDRDCMLGSTTLAFDISVLELFLPLTVGATLVLAEQATLSDPQALAALIEAAGCTFAQGTPSKWRYLLDAGWAGKPDLTVMCGGEVMTRDLADRLLARCAAVWNGYGPTETTVCSTLAKVTREASPPHIGWPVDDTSLHILDDVGRPVPDGEVGDLHIGGAGLARGYRNRPDLTQERFVTFEGRRVYRTGDLVRRHGDGALQYLGRRDDQVKVRGFRVELAEVEAALLQCEGVAWAAVTARPGEDGEATLAAHVVLRGGTVLDPVQLRRALAERLPRYMIPHRIVQMESLPLTGSGKVDRSALPFPAPGPRREAQTRSPSAMVETTARLGRIWAEVLGVATVSSEDNFFDLGGYSLLTLKLLRRIQDAFGRTLTMAQLFATADLAAMARLLDDPNAPAPLHIALQPLGRRPPLIWFDVGPQLRPLAERLAPDQPFIGLNLPDEGTGLGPCAAEIGARLVQLVKAYQPQGPYYLGGWCRWGVMAYAAAERLLAQGEDVALLVLLDATNSASPCQIVHRHTRRVKQALKRCGSDTPSTPAGLGQVAEAAARRYRPPPYRGNVLLLRAADAERDWDDCSGWRDVVKGRLEVRDLPGDHASVLRPPHVDALAAALHAGLGFAQRSATPLNRGSCRIRPSPRQAAGG